LAAFFLTTVFPAEAQQQTKVAKIGELLFRDRPGLGAGRQAFRSRLLELGYVEGKNVTFESRSAAGNPDRFPALADELIHLKVDLLVASSTSEALAFKKATTTIPIVFIISSDPVADGLVSSMARPGGNLTGVTTIATTLAGKRLELLKETIPNVSRVALFWDPRSPSDKEEWKESQKSANELGMQLHSFEVSSADKYEDAFKEAIKARSTALAVMPSSLATANPKRIADLAVKYRLPAIFDREKFVASGGLISYGPDRFASYRRAAVYVDKILKGAKPADLPAEQPTKFELWINLKTAKQIGLTVPQRVLLKADRVIK
jgi:putative tryptophan/tyrosine transport system substrate-binding protein